MTSRPDRSTTAGAAYLDLRRLAQTQGRPTDVLLQLYALEGFLVRLTHTTHAGGFVLKGGVLLAAYGDRRPTRDLDFAASGLDADAADVDPIIREVLAVDLDDGLIFDRGQIDIDAIREGQFYPGIRATIRGALSTARIRFHIDLNIGDPLWPAPEMIDLPRLLVDEPIRIRGYRVELILAEKIVTAIQRGTANTRWRDFVDIAALATSTVDNEVVAESIRRVATHRHAPLAPLRELLDGFAPLAQARWSAWRRRQQLANTPAQFIDLLETVMSFADPRIEQARDA